MQAVRSSVARMGGMGVRRMAGGHGHGTPVQYTGIEASVRKMLPENYQISMGILGLYGSLIAIGVLKSKAGKSSAISNQPAPTAPDYTTPLAKSSDIPALEQDKEWEAFINAAPENFEKWIVSIETLPVA